MNWLNAVLMVIMAGALSGCITSGLALNAALDCAREPEPVPVQRRVELPLRLRVDVRGQERLIEDVQVCEYARSECVAGVKQPVWKESFASGNATVIVDRLDSGAYYEFQVCDCSLQVEGIQCSLNSAGERRIRLRQTSHSLEMAATVSGVHGIRILEFDQPLPARDQ
ncbi:hypothetical protein [Lysobacter sp.]|uniref:hypothetical protein n=1 Tax=Lysobacter sp. TaxID=72226 RepID=UPI002D267A85|nr:hypothetical protein [Lysobacter sp.]HZX77033.1 hypothetical protein [Lysobacter sp.]